jgi:acyl-CoA thioesterase FadM
MVVATDFIVNMQRGVQLVRWAMEPAWGQNLRWHRRPHEMVTESHKDHCAPAHVLDQATVAAHTARVKGATARPTVRV